jgi:hypothetical protein
MNFSGYLYFVQLGPTRCTGKVFNRRSLHPLWPGSFYWIQFFQGQCASVCNKSTTHCSSSNDSHNSGPPDDLECLRGQLLAKWSYVRIDALIERGLHEAIDELQGDLNQLHQLIHARYFVTTDLGSIPTDPSCALS